MELHSYHEPANFLQQTQSYLEDHETINSLILGIALRLKEHPEWIDSPPYLAVVADGSKIELAAVITPPYNLVLAGSSQPPEHSLNLLTRNLQEQGRQFPGVNAESRLSHCFAQAWARFAKVRYSIRMRMRAYELRRVILPQRLPPGRLRPAALQDLDLITQWRAEFIRESLGNEPPENIREIAERFIQTGTTFVWDDEGPASMSLVTRPTPNGITIGGVYTPSYRRGRGYASACVAQLSQKQLDAGKAFCTLFTDLKNPVSNSIYQKIGYQAVCDFTEYGFG